MKLLAIVGLGLAAAGTGAGTVFVADKLYWDNELKVQMAGRDKIIAELNDDAVKINAQVDKLKETNGKLRSSIESSMKNAVALAGSNKSNREKVDGVIAQLENLLTALDKLEDQP